MLRRLVKWLYARRVKMARAIMDYLAQQIEPKSIQEISKGSGVGYTAALLLLSDLVDNGSVEMRKYPPPIRGGIQLTKWQITGVGRAFQNGEDLLAPEHDPPRASSLRDHAATVERRLGLG